MTVPHFAESQNHHAFTQLKVGIGSPTPQTRALPDGSGYYELRLLEREAQVVFHPLP